MEKMVASGRGRPFGENHKARSLELTAADLAEMKTALARSTVHDESMDAANMSLCERAWRLPLRRLQRHEVTDDKH
jgi:hypothetical protein